MEEGVFVGWLKKDGERGPAGDALFTPRKRKGDGRYRMPRQRHICASPPDGPKAGDTRRRRGRDRLSDCSREKPCRAEQRRPPAPRAPASPPRPQPAVAEPRAAPAERPPQLTGQPLPAPAGSRASWASIGRRSGAAAAPAASANGTSARRPPMKRRRTAGQSPSAPMRRTIAERMMASLRSTAPVTLTTTVDATNLVNLRNQFKAVAGGDDRARLHRFPRQARRRRPAKASAAGRALGGEDDRPSPRQSTSASPWTPTPGCSSRWCAMCRPERAAGGGPYARPDRPGPARDAAAAEMRGRRLHHHEPGGVRRRRVHADHQLSRSAPSSASAGFSAGPRWSADQIVVRDQVTLSLTFDHRIVDGAPAARFLQTLTQYVENPGPWLMP